MSKLNFICSAHAKIVSTTCAKFLSLLKIGKACLWLDALLNHVSTRIQHHTTGILLNPVPSLSLVPHAALLFRLGSVTFRQPPLLFPVHAQRHSLPRRMCVAHLHHRSHHVPACPCTTCHLQIQWPQLMLQLRPTYCWHALTYA